MQSRTTRVRKIVDVSRQPRGDLPEGAYHVTLRSAGPVEMFVDNVDRADFCRRLSRVVRRLGWRCLSFCLMTTHYHLLLHVPANRLQPGMHELNGQYAQQFNERHGRSGHLCGDRYHAEPVLSDGHLLRSFRYIARNPVKAGLCESPADWLWSSYRGTAGLDGQFAFVDDTPVRNYFGGDTDEAIRQLRGFVEDT
jgi:REP-associated tyrosine transposase